MDWLLNDPRLSFSKNVVAGRSGGTGKSTIINVIIELLGEHNVAAVKLNKLSTNFALSDMEGKLVNISPEVLSESTIADDTIKSLVSGDQVTIERKGENAYTARLCTRLMCALNILPKVRDHSNAFYRRLLIIETRHPVPEKLQDTKLMSKLQNELPGIFNRVLAGLQRLLAQDGFTVPQSSTKLVKDYATSSDVVKSFVNEHCKSSTMRISVAEVYSVFVDYCRQNGHRCPPSNTEFGKRMTLAGFQSKKSQKRYYEIELFNIP